MKHLSLLLLLCTHIAFAESQVDYLKLISQANQQYLQPIRPGYEGRNPFWNYYAKKFTYVPAFEFAKVPKAVKYRFSLYQDPAQSYTWHTPYQQYPDDTIHLKLPVDASCGYLLDFDEHRPGLKVYTFEADTPTSPLTPIWETLPVGFTKLVVEGIDSKGRVVGKAGSKFFLRDYPFRPPYPSPVRSYREVALRAMLYIHNMPSIQHWADSLEPDMSYRHNTYACKIIGSTVRLEVSLAKLLPHRKSEFLTIATHAAEFLMRESQPVGSPLAYFPPTYYKGLVASAHKENQGTTLVMEASTAAQAYLDLYDVTNDNRWLQEACHIADTYCQLQRADGSFPVKVNIQNAQPTGKSNALLHPLLTFLKRLNVQYGIKKYADMQQRGEHWMNTTAVSSFEMKGQFEDVSVLGWKPYMNLTNTTAAPYASYLLTKQTTTPQEQADAIDLIRFSEDQFLHWDALPDADGIHRIPTPCVYEQYEYRVPVDASTSHLLNAYIDWYQYNGDILALEKAKALASSITHVQNTVNGQLPSTWDQRTYASDAKRAFWVNCTYQAAQALLRMENLLTIPKR